MDKPTVYIDTTIAGHLTSRLPNSVVVAGQMLLTRDWWDHSRPRFECFTSERVLEEAGRGDPVPAAERLQVLAELPVVRPADVAAVERVADLLLACSALPPKARVDAFPLATAAVTGMAYLLTWNCATWQMRPSVQRSSKRAGTAGSTRRSSARRPN